MTRNKLLARKPKITSVEIDGETFHIKTMSLAETNAWQTSAAALEAEHGKSAAMNNLLVHALVEENGTRLFQDDEVQLAIESFTFAEANALIMKAIEINKLAKEEPAKLADAAKN